MAYKKKMVPATTNNIQTGILNLLNSEGHCAARINVQGQWDEALQLWRPSGSTKGVYDIVCCLAPKGRMLIVDTKRGRDKLRADQIIYRDGILAAGGIAYEAKTYPEFEDYYFNTLKPTLK